MGPLRILLLFDPHLPDRIFPTLAKTGMRFDESAKKVKSQGFYIFFFSGDIIGTFSQGTQ